MPQTNEIHEVQEVLTIYPHFNNHHSSALLLTFKAKNLLQKLQRVFHGQSLALLAYFYYTHCPWLFKKKSKKKAFFSPKMGCAAIIVFNAQSAPLLDTCAIPPYNRCLEEPCGKSLNVPVLVTWQWADKSGILFLRAATLQFIWYETGMREFTSGLILDSLK